MINGFEKETKELTDYELTIVPIMVAKLKKNVGEEKAVKNIEIQRQLKLLGYEKINAARIRKLIHYIRVNNLVTNLIATSKGYYRATNKKDLEKFVESLQQRINSIYEIKNSFV